MAELPEQDDLPVDDKPSLVARIDRLREAATKSRGRTIASLSALLVAVGATIGGWLYTAELAIAPSGPTTEDALEALDQGDWEKAEELASKLQNSGTDDTTTLSVALYVLGSVRAHEASRQWSEHRRWLDYMVASKYLLKSLEFGIPEERELDAMRAAAESLLEAHRIDKAIELLRQAMVNAPDDYDRTPLHALLAHAYSSKPSPDLVKALQHSTALIDVANSSDPDFDKLLISHIMKLARLGRITEARDWLEKVPSETPDRRLVEARLDLMEGQRFLRQAEMSNDDTDLMKASQLFSSAVRGFESIPRSHDNWHLAHLLWAEALALLGEDAEAIAKLGEIRRKNGLAQIATLSSLAEGDIYRRQERFNKAETAYRRAINSLGDIRLYANDEVPLDELRRRFIAAVEDFQFQNQYEIAGRLAMELRPVLGRARQLELLADNNSAWGKYLIHESERAGWLGEKGVREGRQHLREAGVNYEQLSRLRFASPEYVDDLWKSCEAYFAGHSYTSTIRVLNDYLKYEPEKRNAQALLRLGQSRLARFDNEGGIDALEECIELYPDDAATYQARIDCAGGYRERGNPERAEELLRANLSGSLQSPRSPEWRDSLFSLGFLMHEVGRYEEAIDRLEEAVDRYPKDRKARLATYLVADSYREAAEVPLQALREAQTENERETATRKVDLLLTEAITRYEQVQRDIALSADPDALDRAMLRNCYMMRADALFDLRRYDEASKAYANLSTLYQRDPYVLETLVQIANCARRLGQNKKAQLTVEQARQALERLPADADFLSSTNFTRDQWRLLLTDMSKWSTN